MASVPLHTKLAHKSLLFSKDRTWLKKSGNKLFYVTMGSFDAAEICELVGLYLLNQLSKLLGMTMWDCIEMTDMLQSKAVLLDKMRKSIIAFFKEKDLTVTIATNLIETNFPDVTFNLATVKFFSI